MRIYGKEPGSQKPEVKNAIDAKGVLRQILGLCTPPRIAGELARRFLSRQTACKLASYTGIMHRNMKTAVAKKSP